MPLELDDITNKDMPLVAAFQKFTTRVHAAENFSFWFDKGNNEGRYEKYIKKGSPKELTLDNSDLMHDFTDLAREGNYAGMNAAFAKARLEVSNMLTGRMNEFSNSPEYKAYLAVKKAGNITKALKLLGVKPAFAKPMELLLKEYATATTASAKQAAITKMSKMAKAEQVEAVLKSSGLM